MGAAARQRALETFHPNVVMSQIEGLFQELCERRQQAASSPTPSSPQLDLVRTFEGYATTGVSDSIPLKVTEEVTSLPLPVCAFRDHLWDLIRESLPEERHVELWEELVRKHSHDA